MWRDQDYPDPQYNATSVHPNLKKKFNPYEILQPQKLPMNGVLIDIGVSDEATCLDPINIASNTSEKGFSNIDLLENILVSPQLVNNQPTTERNIDFEDFFNKLESGTKCDWVKSNTDNVQIGNSRTDSGVLSPSDRNTYAKELEIDSLFNDIVKNNQRFSERETLSVSNDYEDMNIQEDFIEEVLLEKTMEKITLSDTKPREYKGQIKVLPTPKVITGYEHNEFDRFKTNNNFNPTASNHVKILNENMKNPESKSDNHNDKMFFKTNILKSNNEYNSEARKEYNFNAPKIQNIAPHSNIASPSYSDNKQSNATIIHLSALKSILEDESLKSNVKNPHEPINRKFAIKETPISPELLSQSNQKCMTKDAKHFAKYFMPNNDPNKYAFTHGPSYEEKIIALPNILKRLNEQKRAYELKKNMSRRLILDEGAKRRNSIKQITDFYPTYLKEDCNKERLEAYMIGKKFENFVKNGNHF